MIVDIPTAVAQIATFTKLTQKDVEDLVETANKRPQYLPIILRSYQDDGVVDDVSTWQRIGEILLQVAPYAGAAATIIGLVGAAKSL